MDPAPWTRNRVDVLELLYWLEENGHITSAAHAIAVVEKPGKWADERQQMLEQRDAEDQAERDELERRRHRRDARRAAA